MKIKNKFFTLLALLLIIGIEAEPFDSTYIAKPSATSLLKNANIYDGEGNEFLGYDLLIKNGKIEAIGSGLDTSCLLYTSPSPRDPIGSRMPSSA